MLKKILAWLLVISTTATIAIGGTLAYLTDRDSEANVFTVGDVEIDLKEDFEHGAELIPGVEIEKKPTITNTGINDAWVWLEFAIPSALDNWALDTQEGSNANVIHWNQLGATTEGYVTETRVTNAIAAGHLPEGTTVESITTAKSTWNLGGKTEFSRQAEIDGVMYNIYVIGYNKALTPGEETLPNIYKVFLDSRVDIDPDGNWNFVESGNVTKLDWNSNTNGNPVIYVSAYAMQAEGFNDVDEAISAYQKQWGDNGGEIPKLPTLVRTVEEMRAALASGGNVILGADLVVEKLVGGSSYGDGFMVGKDAVIDLNGHNITMSPDKERGALFFVKNATVTIKGDGEILVNNANWVWASSNSVVNIEGGTWLNEVSTCEGMYVTSGQLNIFDGFFSHSRTNRTLNVQQKHLTSDSLNIYGGTYVKCDPSAIPDDGNLVEEGYKVVSETQENGDIWYTVVPE